MNQRSSIKAWIDDAGPTVGCDLYFKIQQQGVPDQQEASEIADTNISNVNLYFTKIKAEAAFVTRGGRITNHYRLTAFVEPLFRIGTIPIMDSSVYSLLH